MRTDVATEFNLNSQRRRHLSDHISKNIKKYSLKNGNKKYNVATQIISIVKYLL